MKRFLYLSMALIFLLGMFPAAAAAKGTRPAPLRVAVPLIVNSTNDVVDGACDGTHCSLREAIQYSAAGDTIEFNLTMPATITLANGPLHIEKALTITGPGADELTISGGGVVAQNNHVFEFYYYGGTGPAFDVTLSGLTITGGRASNGGGINKASPGKLTLNDCVIGPNNIATSAGGGISVFTGTVEMNRSSVVGNQATGTYSGAGIYVAYSTLTLTNSTVSGNVTNNFGGGILVDFSSTVSLKHSTVTANTANQDAATTAAGGAGGIYILSATAVQVQNSIVAGNTDLTNPATANHAKWPDVYGAFTSQGGNLIGDRTGSTGWSASDRVGTAATPIDPLLGALTLNTPGSTPTHALLAGSTALEAAACLPGITIDQRSEPRPQPALAAKCDAGAYESDLVPPADTTAPVVTVPENMTVGTTDASGVVVTFEATAFDNVDGVLTPICTPASGATFPVGDTLVTCTATDAAKNEGSASFTVTVTTQYMRVGAISMAAKAGHTYTYSGSVTILSYGDVVVSKAAVTVAWYKDVGSGFVLLTGLKSSTTSMTNRLGVAKFTLRGEAPLQSGTYQLCVENVVKPGFSYVPALNTPTCSTVAVPIP